MIFFGVVMMGLILVLKMFVPSLRGKRPNYISKNLAECVQIIAGRMFDGNNNTLSKFETRARANRRLIFAFGIDNAFTTEKSEQYNDYIKAVGKLLRPDWNMIACNAKGLASTYQHPQHPQQLTRLTQSFVLKITIMALYQREISALDDEMISFVAEEINRIWMQSKMSCGTTQWTDQHRLHEAISRLVPNCNPLDSQTNPMNVILPAFETMWRVVLRCFIEVRFRGAQEMDEWTAALEEYLRSPDAKDEHTCEERKDIATVSSIIREALRLYPPTRHIHRHFEFASHASVFAIANIEGLHRDTEIWGADATCFKPSRWASISPRSTQYKAWLPFGASPFVCPAKPDFGPKMIGVLVAALVEAFCDPKYELRLKTIYGQLERAPVDGPLRSERNSYERYFIVESDIARCDV